MVPVNKPNMLAWVVAISFLATACLSHKVLLFPMPASSHAWSFYYIGQWLLDGGHEVHFLLHWGFEVPERWTGKDAKGAGFFFHTYGNRSASSLSVEAEASRMMLEVMTNNYDNGHVMREMMKFIESFSRDLLGGNERLMERLEALELDVAVVDHTFFMRYPVLVARRLRLPLVSYTDIVEPWLIRTPWMPSIHSPFVHSGEGGDGGFFRRLVNTLLLAQTELLPSFPDLDCEIVDAFSGRSRCESLREIARGSVLFLVTDDPVLDPVRPYTANVVSVGGLTTEALGGSSSFSSSSSSSALPPPLLPPQDYLEFIRGGSSSEPNEPTNSGTVVVSFGSLVSRLPERLAKIFVEAFGSLAQFRFVWRFDNHLNLTVPRNVKVVRWLAQKELLGHSSVRLFITHSGNNGQFEAVYHGVPMLAVPLLGDQPKNARRIVERGYGEELDFRTLGVEGLTATIVKIITDPSYKERVTKASKIFKSRPDTPAQRAAFWIEHVVRFGGDHLKPIGNDLTFWQYLCLDVLLFIELVLAVLVLLVVLATRKLAAVARWLVQKRYGKYESSKKQN